MEPGPRFSKTVRSLLRARLLTAAAELTCENGWSSVTMGKVAARVGVSRQTVYKELGSKPELAEALMLRETDGFAAGVAQTISAYPDDAVEGVTAAFQYALESARDNPLLKSVLAGDGLLPLLTTRSDPVLARSVGAVAPVLIRLYPAVELTGAEWEMAVEAFVRLLLSHLVQPAMSIPHATGQMRWVIGRMLRSRPVKTHADPLA